MGQTHGPRRSYGEGHFNGMSFHGGCTEKFCLRRLNVFRITSFLFLSPHAFTNPAARTAAVQPLKQSQDLLFENREHGVKRLQAEMNRDLTDLIF